MAYILLIKGERAHKGMEVTDFRGDKFTLTDWKQPGIGAGPNGKVYCKDNNGKSYEWYPSVIFGAFEEKEFPYYLKKCADYDDIKHLPCDLLYGFEKEIEAYENDSMEGDERPLAVQWYTGAISTDALLSEYAYVLEEHFQHNLSIIRNEIIKLSAETHMSYDEILKRIKKELVQEKMSKKQYI